MIYTCTTNPSLDYYITIPSVELGSSNRSDMEMYDAGGKGVNVSIVLNNFRIPSIAMGFLGGFTKDFYLSFIANYPNIQPLFVSIKDNTRINVKIMDSHNETSINAVGPKITDEEFNKFRSRINSIYAGDYFVLSGNVEEEIKQRIIEVVKELSENGVKVIIDSDADVLSRCKGIKLYAVKLNDSNIDSDVKKAAAYHLDNGVENVLYSSPGKPSFVFTKEETLECNNQADSLVNAIGSADSMVAGFIYGSLRGATTIESFKYANAASIATCMSNDLGSKEKIEELFTTIEVKNI